MKLFLFFIAHCAVLARGNASYDEDVDVDGLIFTISASATGAQEVPPVDTITVAYLDMEFNPGFLGASYDVSIFRGVAVTQGHLHCGKAGSNGPVLATLFDLAPIEGPDGVDFLAGSAGSAGSGTLTSEDLIPQECGDVNISNLASLYEAILQRLVYVNVHTEANPSGEARGQIFL